MRIAHLLRKYNPAEWGGTETAIQRLLEGLRDEQVSSVVYCPFIEPEKFNGNEIQPAADDPLSAIGTEVSRFNAFVPVWGITEKQRRQLISVGGNLMSLDLPLALLMDTKISLVHAHTLGRLAGVARVVAARRRIPFVISIHGGALDMNDGLKASLDTSGPRGVEWGKIFGLLLRSRDIFNQADAIIACNETEAARLRGHYPHKRVLVQPHGLEIGPFEVDQRSVASSAFPQIVGKQILLCVSRIDPVKNQEWLVQQMPDIIQKHPDVMLVLVGACTNSSYGQRLNEKISALGLEKYVLQTGGLPPGDSRLIGLLQQARVGMLASVSETFGLVLLEAWAAKVPVLSSRTSGATALVKDGENGFLFDLEAPTTFHNALKRILCNADLAERLAESGNQLVREKFTSRIVARQMKCLYEELIEEKQCATS